MEIKILGKLISIKNQIQFEFIFSLNQMTSPKIKTTKNHCNTIPKSKNLFMDLHKSWLILIQCYVIDLKFISHERNILSQKWFIFPGWRTQPLLENSNKNDAWWISECIIFRALYIFQRFQIDRENLWVDSYH